MLRHHFLVAIFGIATLNGILNPFTWFAVLLLTPLSPALMIGPTLHIMFSMILFATVTVIAAGIPAAIYERVRGLEDSDEISLWIWLASTAVLSIPAITNLISIGF